MPKLRVITPTASHELFYHGVMAAAVLNKLNDAEIVAILSSIVGRMCGAAAVGEDRDTLTDTAIFNMKQGREEIPGLLEALGKGH